MLILGAIAFVAVLFSTNESNAQCRGIFRRAACNVSVAPVVAVHEEVVTPVVATVAVPVFIPAFQFQYQPPYISAPYTPAYSPTVMGQPPLGVGAPLPTYGQPYYGHQPQMQASPISSQDRIRELAKALLDEMSRQSNGPDNGPPSVPSSSTKIPPGLPTGSISQPALSPELAAPYAIAALQQNCSACHTGPASKGGFVMFAQPGLFNSQVSWRSIIQEVESGRMPPNYSQYRLTTEQIVAIRSWLNGI